jgi:hypothetical protein
MLMEGCSFSVSGTLSVIIDALQGLLKYIGGSQPWAVELSNALSALEQAEASWKTGGAAAIVIDALNTIEAVVAVIPFTALYSPLIDLIISGIEAVINYFAPQSMKFTRERATIQNNPHKGRVALKASHFLQTPAGSFKQQYNDTAIGIGLPQLRIAG